ncbi:MAG TPA: GNAT family N-acetyltransferase [Noviherbaspirillum sp.]|nr:GNAT family N-acetyltransferase [Noviherbaspirillum sp.]
MRIREITPSEFGLVWPIFHAVVASGDTYAYDPSTSFEEAKAMWTTPPARVFVAEEGDLVLGCYVLKPNQGGLGDHVANAGYMVAPDARGKGVASALCEHSLDAARAAGFSAMQFNFVVASNTTAVALWLKHGFEIVGRVPNAFRHRTQGLTDVFVMYRPL